MIVEIVHKEQKKALLVALTIAKFNLLIILVFNVKMVILNFIILILQGYLKSIGTIINQNHCVTEV